MSLVVMVVVAAAAVVVIAAAAVIWLMPHLHDTTTVPDVLLNT